MVMFSEGSSASKPARAAKSQKMDRCRRIFISCVSFDWKLFGFAPLRWVKVGESGITLHHRTYTVQMDIGCIRESQSIDLAAPGNYDFPDAAPLREPHSKPQGILQIRGYVRALGRKTPIPRDDDRVATIERLPDRLIGFSAHHHRASNRQGPKAFETGRHPPGHIPIPPDDPIATCGNDQ